MEKKLDGRGHGVWLDFSKGKSLYRQGCKREQRGKGGETEEKNRAEQRSANCLKKILTVCTKLQGRLGEAIVPRESQKRHERIR